VVDSAIPRSSNGSLYTHAGPEIGVASTKCFTAQLAALLLLAVYLGRRRGTLTQDRQSMIWSTPLRANLSRALPLCRPRRLSTQRFTNSPTPQPEIRHFAPGGRRKHRLSGRFIKYPEGWFLSHPENRRAEKMTNVFVGNLASNRTPDELRTLFQTYGPVNAVEIVTDPETRYSRGFAFVEMRDDLEARRAVTHLNGVVLWGKPIQVAACVPQLQPRAQSE
jgi:hypothetical protein